MTSTPGRKSGAAEWSARQDRLGSQNRVGLIGPTSPNNDHLAGPAEPTRHLRSLRRRGLFALIASMALLAASCVGTPGYVIDIFPEMHYSPVYRPQEPPRLSPPADSVPVGGKEVSYTLEEARPLKNPLPQGQETLARGVQVFLLNCSVCHGPTGGGNGPMAERFAKAGATPPLDFTSQRALGLTDGELFYFITNGTGFMPRFGPLLSPEDRWAAVQYIRTAQR